MTGPPLRVLVNAINDNALPRGPDRYLLEILPQILAADPDISILVAVAPWQRAFLQGEFDARVRMQCLSPPRAPARRLLWQATRFVAFANARAPDVTFLPNLIWTPGLRSPQVMTVHDMLHFRAPEKFGRVKAALLRRVIGCAIARSTRTIAVSRFTAQEVARFARPRADSLRVIAEGGPPARTRKTGASERLFLFVGKLERTKGLEALIDAFQGSEALRAAGYRLVIAGPDGNASERVGRLIARAPAGIERTGFVPPEDLGYLFSVARGFVFPSTAEGFGLVVLEAMAHGAPVIAARATSLPEVIGDAGLLVPPDDPVALRAAMERLAADNALFEQLQAAGHARLSAFSWRTAGAETARVLREAAA